MAGASSLNSRRGHPHGVIMNLGTARSWFQKAADQDHADSMRRLGYMMVKGEGGAKDIKGGIDLWASAAEAGDEDSQKNLDMLSKLRFKCF